MHWKADFPPWNSLLLLILRMKALTCTAFSVHDCDDPIMVTMPWVYPSHFVHAGGLLLELRSEYWEHPVVFSARFHTAVWMLLQKITYLLVFITFFVTFNELVKFFKHSSILVISKYISKAECTWADKWGITFCLLFNFNIIVLTHCGIIFASQFPSKPLDYLISLVI